MHNALANYYTVYILPFTAKIWRFVIAPIQCIGIDMPVRGTEVMLITVCMDSVLQTSGSNGLGQFANVLLFFSSQHKLIFILT